MKKRIVFLTVVLLLVCVCMGLVSCVAESTPTTSTTVPTDDSRPSGQTPVYQGMYITTTSEDAQTRIAVRRSQHDPWHGWDHDHPCPPPGEWEGDFGEGGHRPPPPDRPSWGDDTPDIDEKAESTLEVIGATDSIYYADKNQDIYIHIRLSNPDSYEIMSFTLNGQKYSSYMFEEGSDMENLILKMNVGDADGIVEYTIDAIKYVDGTEIKDVLMDGDKTVKAGIRSDDRTNAVISNVGTSLTEVSFDVKLTDLYDLIGKSGGYAKAVLYDGTDMIVRDIAVGNSHVTFDGLVPNTLYQYAVMAYYDDLSGDGVALRNLATGAVYTDAILLFDGVQISYDSLSWSYAQHPSLTASPITAVELYLDGGKVRDLDLTATGVTGLFCNRTYSVVVSYRNLAGETEQIYITATTLAQALPTVGITNVTPSQTEIGFTVNVTDTDEVGNISKVELLHGNDAPIVAESTAARSFTGLLTDNAYTVRVTYTYDLGDGKGEQTLAVTADTKTLAKAVPTVDITNLTSTKTEISFDISYTDAEAVGAVAEVQLYCDGVQVARRDAAAHVTFDGLTSGCRYTIKVVYRYDLGDGRGIIEATAEKQYTTLAASISVSEVVLLNSNIVKAGEEINLRIYFENSSSIELTAIYVNGQKVTVVGGDRMESAIVKFVPDECGLIDFFVDRVEYVLDDLTVAQKIDSDISVRYPVYSDLAVEFTAVTSLPYENSGHGTYLEFPNDYGYKVFRINDSTDFFTMADGQYYIPRNTVTSIEYGYDNYGHTTQTFSYSGGNTKSYNTSDGYKTVSTPEEFLAMTDGYYILTQDLDLRKVTISQTIRFTGVLIGNGHTVRGLSNVIDTGNQTYFDLFASGSFYDVDFTELYISVVTESSLTIYPLGRTKLINCTVKGDINGTETVSVSESDLKNASTSYSLYFTKGSATKQLTATATRPMSRNDNVTYADGMIWFALPNGRKYLIGCCDPTLTQYTVPTDVFGVGSGAFYACKSLVELHIPEYVGYVGGNLLDSTCALEKATLTPGNLNFDKTNLREITVWGNGGIGWGCFENCTNLTKVTIGQGVTTIGNYAFDGCTKLNAVYITDIAAWCRIAFGNLSANPLCYAHNLYLNGELVTDLTIPEGVTAIGNSAFYGCTNLTSVTIPEDVTAIGDYAFYGCTGLTNVTIPEGVIAIGYSAFRGCTNLTSVTIPEGVTVIGGSAFRGCTGLTSVTIPEGVTTIGEGAFYNCTGLTSVTIPESVTTIGDIAFYGCTNLTSVTIPSSVTTIGGAAFEDCTNLASVTILEGVTTIGNSAFYNCTSLTSVTIPSSVTTIGNNAFYGCTKLKAVYITDIAAWCRVEFGSIDANPLYYAHNMYLNGELVTDLIISEGVITIGEYAFSHCTSLTNVIIPEGVIAIGDFAFSGCTGLTSVTIPSSVTTIGSYAFSGCIGFTSVTILEGVTTIGDFAFYGCTGLASMIIPESVTTIGNNAFYFCSKLTTIHFNGTKEQWNAMKIGNRWNDQTPSTLTIVCTDGEISKSEA